MKSMSSKFVVFSAKYFRIVLMVVTLVLFVLAAGAPAATGTIGG